MKHETLDQSVKALPAVGGAIASAVTLNDIVALVTIAYVLTQLGYLIYKWYWAHQDRKKGILGKE